MNEQEVLNVLKKIGAVITNSHIVYTSGKHGMTYVNKDALYPHIAETSSLCLEIAEQFSEDRVETVIAPAIGGVILSQWIAQHLIDIDCVEVFGVYAEKEGKELVLSSYGPMPPKYKDKFIIKRGYEKFVAGKKILVVEDVLTTGSSARNVIEATRMIGGNVIGLGAIVNRGDITPADVGDVPKLVSLINIKLDDYEEGNCPLCKRGIPINTEVGHGKEFLVKKYI